MHWTGILREPNQTSLLVLWARSQPTLTNADAFDQPLLHLTPLELDRQYQVFGRFYGILGTGESYCCRDRLEIHRGNAQDDECDAIFIMMNPGSSKPLVGSGTAPKHQAVMVSTKADTTQYQLMRLMGVLGWKRVRVLNLSDLRNAKSASFYVALSDFAAREGHDGHSIFSDARQSELVSALSRKSGAPVISAWGVSKKLGALAATAMRSLGRISLGLGHQNGPWAFRHPLPKSDLQQIEWRVDALRMLKAAAGARTESPAPSVPPVLGK